MATKGFSFVILACFMLSVWSAGLKSFTISDDRDYNNIDYKISMDSLNLFSIEYTPRNTVPSPELYVVDAFDRVFESSKATRMKPPNHGDQREIKYTYDLSSKCSTDERNVGTPGAKSFCTVFIQLRTAAYSTMYYPIDIEFGSYFNAELYPGGEEHYSYIPVFPVSRYLALQSKLDNLFETRDDCTNDANNLYYADLKIKTRSSPPGTYLSKYIVWTCPNEISSSSRITVQPFNRRFPLITSDCADYPSVSYSMYSRTNCKANIVFETGNSLLSTNIFNQSGSLYLTSYSSNRHYYQSYRSSDGPTVIGIIFWICCAFCCCAIIGGVYHQRRKNYMQATLNNNITQGPFDAQTAPIVYTPTLHQSAYPNQMPQAQTQQSVYQPQPSYYPQPGYYPSPTHQQQ